MLSQLEEKQVTYLKVLVTSALPVVELRGGIPLGLYLGLTLWQSFMASLAGNIMIIYPWLWVLERLEEFLARNKLTAPVYRMLINKVSKKEAMFQSTANFALFLFVAIPLPTTGPGLPVWQRVFRIPGVMLLGHSPGVVAAGFIVLFNSYLVIDVFN